MAVITTLKKIGIDAINREWRSATKSVIESLGNIYIKALESDVLLSSDIGRAVHYAIEDLVEVSLKGKIEFTQEYIAEPIKNICLLAIKSAESKSNFRDLMARIEYDLIGYIIKIGKNTLENEKYFLPPFKTINILRFLIEIGTEIEKIEINKLSDGKISTFMRKSIISMFNPAFKNEEEELLRGGLIQPIGNVGLEISSKYPGYGFYAESKDIEKLDPKRKNELEIEYKWIIRLLAEIGKEVNEKIKSPVILRDLKRDVGDFIIEIGDKCIKEGILKAAEYASKILKDLDISNLVEETLDTHPKFKTIYVSKK